MAKYRVKGGQHDHDNGMRYKAGDVFEEDRDMCKMFPNKFEKLADNLALSSGSPIPGLPTSAKHTNKAPVATENEAQAPADDIVDGVDVTAEFKNAQKNGFCVIQRGNFYDICNAGETEPLNSQSLKKERVAPFIKKLLKKDDE